MPDLKSLDNVYLLLAFLSPGLIVLFVRSRFLTGRAPSQAEASLTYLTISIVYYALALPLVEYIYRAQLIGYGKVGVWLGLVFVGPAVLGVLLGIEARREYLFRFIRNMGLNTVHVIPTAWDWKFGTMTEQWVLVTQKNGTRFAGLCDGRSFISSDPKERDLYIGCLYEVLDDNTWIPRAGKSVLIAAGEISTVEFWPYQT